MNAKPKGPRCVIALLRGVNVGGKNKIKMEALREICASLNLQNARTYVQSGNLLFQTTEKDLKTISERIATSIEESHGFRPSVICLTSTALRDTAARNPFAGRQGLDPGKLAVCFLAEKPSPESRATLSQFKTETEELRIGEQELFIYFENGMGKTKLSMPAVERAVKTAMTARNWNTVENLIEMANRMETAD